MLAFIMVFQIRHQRLVNPEAINAGEAVILIYDPVDLAGLMDVLDGLEINYDRAEMAWAASIMNRDSFLTGRYVLRGGMDYARFFGKLARGEQDAARIIIHPGLREQVFVTRVSRQFRFDDEEFAAVMQDSAFIREELGLAPHLLFGRMIPNTYHMFWTATPQQFFRRMLQEFDKAVAPLDSLVKASGLTVDQVVTFASIIELEAKYDSEKTRIAGLYWNRLNQRWRLQADPTVAYAIGERRRLTFADYRFQHPYNTYTIFGLPPGPITNPALSSIRAVLQPEKHDYMFMVATPEGYHSFTRTYAEHRRESAKWTQWIREQERERRRLEAERERLEAEAAAASENHGSQSQD